MARSVPNLLIVTAIASHTTSLLSAQTLEQLFGEQLFGPEKIWQVELELLPEQFERMQPPGPGDNRRNPSEEQHDSVRNVFGTQFRWARCRFRALGLTLEDVGIRYAGDITYLVTAMAWKRPMVISFDKFRSQTFQGISTLHFHAMPLDPTKAREVFASFVMQNLGVLVPRAGFAEVWLTVPGRLERFYLGLYTVVEDVDAAFFERHLGSGTGLVMKPLLVRQMDYLGESWSAYEARYRPTRQATESEQRRMIEFARLVHQSSDEVFARRINSFLDVERFLDLLAAQSLLSDLNSVFAVGANYTLYLDTQSGKFYFVPNDMEFSCAAMLLFGSPDELMDLRLLKPYPERNRLLERLLAIDALRQRYLEKLRKFRFTTFTKEFLANLVTQVEGTTKAARERERRSTTFGAPAAAPPGPQPPDLLAFIEARLRSVDQQLDGRHEGYAPRPLSFAGPAPMTRSGPSEPINEQVARQLVRVVAGFEWSLFAAPPEVNYPVAIACEPHGAVYVAVDQQGSLGREPGGGKILRCVDENDDGRADKVTTYATVDHPRGMVFRNGKLWVMHPPTLSVFEDGDGDGVADRRETLVTGLTTELLTQRGGDHTTNCVRMGIDGWLYIGVGDYGIKEAIARDGSRVSLRGGGIVRVRPDGSELEIFCTGLRNPFDVAIDPYLNIFTRDNTNDGAGWDVRVSLIKQYAHYGYPQLFANFTDEIMPPLGSFGNGGGSGALFIDDSSWPKPFDRMLLTADWGRSQVYYHPLVARGASFDMGQEVFCDLPRATGMDIDGCGRLYIASWYGGEASVYVGPNVGFVIRVVPQGWKMEAFPDLKKASSQQLLRYLISDNGVLRLHTQGELLERKGDLAPGDKIVEQLFKLAGDRSVGLAGRVAAIFTLKQLLGESCHSALASLYDDSTVREYVLRALTDRRSELKNIEVDWLARGLEDPSERVRAQAVISVARLGHRAISSRLLPCTLRRESPGETWQGPPQNQPDPGRVVPHLAVRALVELQAVEDCLQAVGGPYSRGALQALGYMHFPETVEGLIGKLRTAVSAELRREILRTLMRLHYREAPYDGSWWGIRPDTTGPYYDPQEWSMTPRIQSVLAQAVSTADEQDRRQLEFQLRRHGIFLPGILEEVRPEPDQPTEPLVRTPSVDPNDPNLIGNLPFDQVLARTLRAAGNPERGARLFETQSCTACHAVADGQAPKGPHLFEITKRYKPEELVESIVRPSAKLAQGYETYQFILADGRIVQGFIVSERARSVLLRQSDGREVEIAKHDIEERRILTTSSMPEGLVGNLTPEQLGDILSYLQTLK